MRKDQLILGLVCVLSICIGQIFFKVAAMTMGPIKNLTSLCRQIINPYLIAAVSVNIGTVFLWVWLLSEVPLKKAYPLMGLVFVIVPLLSRIFFGERIELKAILGGLIIIMGVYLSVK